MEYNFDKDAVILQGPEEIRTVLGMLGVAYANNTATTYRDTDIEILDAEEAILVHKKLEEAIHDLRTSDEVFERYLRVADSLGACAIFQRRECLLA